jgi:hypothetical protein
LRIEAFTHACWQICAESPGAVTIELRHGAGARAFTQKSDVECPYWGPRSKSFVQEAGAPARDAGGVSTDETSTHDADAGVTDAAADGGKKDGGTGS